MKSMKKLTKRLVKIAADVAAVGKGALSEIKGDVETLLKTPCEKLEALIDRVTKEDFFTDILHGFIEDAEKGHDVACKYLKKRYKAAQKTLDEAAKTKPEAVGFLDGIIHILLAIPAKRRPKSKLYRTGAKYGRVIGFAMNLLIFSPMIALKVLAALPVVSRLAIYLKDKLQSAADENVRRKAAAASAKPKATRKKTAKRARPKVKAAKRATAKPRAKATKRAAGTGKKKATAKAAPKRVKKKLGTLKKKASARRTKKTQKKS